MKLLVLISFVVAIWNVEAFSLKLTKRMTGQWQECFAHIGEGIFKHYTKDEGGEWFAGYIGGILKECLAKEGKQKDCLIGKKDEVHEIVNDEKDLNVVMDLMTTLHQICEAIDDACHDKPVDEMMECAGTVVDADKVCLNEEGDIDQECVMLVQVMEMLAIQCLEKNEEAPEKRVLVKTFERLRSLFESNSKLFMKSK